MGCPEGLFLRFQDMVPVYVDFRARHYALNNYGELYGP